MEALDGDERAEFELGVAYATQQCADLLRRGAPGIHLYALNRSPAARAILGGAARRPALGGAGARRRRLSAPPRLPPPMPEFDYNGHSISYDEYGEGDRPLVLVHGLLMSRRMFDRLGPEMAALGNRVIAIDLLGHGRSDRPDAMSNYSMTFFAVRWRR